MVPVVEMKCRFETYIDEWCLSLDAHFDRRLVIVDYDIPSLQVPWHRNRDVEVAYCLRPFVR